MTEGNLHFIVSHGPKLQKDDSVRALIRKQAMKNVAQERRKRGNYGRVNLGQLPAGERATNVPIRPVVRLQEPPGLDHLETTALDDSASSTTIDLNEHDEMMNLGTHTRRRNRATTGALFARPSRVSPPLPPTGYEAVCSRFQISVTDLSMLTNFNVGKGTIYMLSADPTRLASLLSHSQWSYLQFVPSRYGSSECLTAATDCLLAKARNVLIPYKGDGELELKLYMKALKALQAALQDDSTCMGADVLCATQLLSLHELLEPTRAEAWSQHIQGSTRLVKHRTPDRFQSEFDKALFAAHVGPIVFESLVISKHCYLENPEWTELYHSLAMNSDSLDDRSPLTIRIRSQMLLFPGLWHDVGEAVMGDGFFDHYTMAALESRCRSVHNDQLICGQDYAAYCMNNSLSSPSLTELAKRRELFGVLLECLAIAKRLLATVCDRDRIVLEQDAQSAAEMILELQKHSSVKFSWLFAGHEVGVAHSVISTKEQWISDFSHLSEYDQKMISRQRFFSWSSILKN